MKITFKKAADEHNSIIITRMHTYICMQMILKSSQNLSSVNSKLNEIKLLRKRNQIAQPAFLIRQS